MDDNGPAEAGQPCLASALGASCHGSVYDRVEDAVEFLFVCLTNSKCVGDGCHPTNQQEKRTIVMRDGVAVVMIC